MTATSFHFGDGDRTLYGVYHSPGVRRRRPLAVLLLNPFGEEAIRSYRVQKIIAERLAALGAAVLRFDYYGAGDSAGECVETSIDGMQTDILTAHEELIDLSNIRRVAWCGLGLAVPVALSAFSSANVNLAKFLGWDPVISGSEYIDDLTASHAKYLADALDMPERRIRRELSMQLTEVMGFGVSESLISDVAELELNGSDLDVCDDVALIGRKSSGAFRKLHGQLTSTASSVSIEFDESVTWNSHQALNSIIVPNDSIAAIVRALADGDE